MNLKESFYIPFSTGPFIRFQFVENFFFLIYIMQQVLFMIIIVLNYKCIVSIINVVLHLHKISEYIFMNFIMLTLVFPDKNRPCPCLVQKQD